MSESLETWLRRRPRPAELRLQVGGQQRSMPLSTVRSWAAVAQSVAAVNADVVEALGPQGELLRVLNPEQLDALETDTPSAAAVTMAAPSSVSDPETRRFEMVAKLIADAYRHSTEVAFVRMVDLFEAVNSRQSSLEKSLDHTHKLLRRVLEDQIENAPEPAKDEDLLSSMAQSFMGGMTQAPPAPTNGKHS